MDGELLKQHIMKIGSAGFSPRFQYRAVFTSGTLKIESLAVSERIVNMDFASSFTTDQELRVSMTVANYNLLFAKRDNLSVTLFQEQIDPISESLIPTGKRYQQTYRAFLRDNEIASQSSDRGMQNRPYSDGKDDLRVFTIDLVDPCALSMSAQNAQAVFRLSTAFESMRSFIVNKNETVRALGLPALLALDAVEPDITGDDAIRDQIIVDHTVKLVQLPVYLQGREGGIYNHDIGSFIKDRKWFIYPLYNTRRYTTTTRRLTVYATSSLKVPITDTTFLKEGESISIICMGAIKTQDLSVAGDISGGLGTRFTKATKFFEEQTIDTGDNRAVYNREAFDAAVRTKAREDGLEFAPVSGNAFTDNLARELSRISMRSGMLMFVTWQKSMVDLLVPGMPVRVYYDDGRKVNQLEGTLLQAQEQSTPERPGLMQKLQKSVAGLFLFLEKK